MRTKMVAVLLGLILAASFAAPAQAAQVLYWQGLRSPGLNQVSPKGTVTYIVAHVRVPKGHKIIEPGYLNLSLTNGRSRTVKCRVIPRTKRRLAECLVRVGRKAKVQTGIDKRNTYIYPFEVTEGATARMRLWRQYFGADV